MSSKKDYEAAVAGDTVKAVHIILTIEDMREPFIN
jgi:hypothetical protein